jgi:mannose-6-phosphate isomerase-like protein (cupin superfamily)
MPIKIVDLAAMAAQPDAKRQGLINGPHFHAWFHVYPEPGEKDEMHCHNSDQTFYMIDGECTMTFPDGGKAVLKPGMCALITGGSFYELQNTGTGKMVLLGTRSISSEQSATIGYETRKELRPEKQDGYAPAPTGTRITI